MRDIELALRNLMKEINTRQPFEGVLVPSGLNIRLEEAESALNDKSSQAIIWSVEDFEWRAAEYERNGTYSTDYTVRYDRSKFEHALCEMVRRHDSNHGITWDTVDYYLDEICRVSKYYIGDPCYVIEGGKWSSFMERVFGDGDTPDYSTLPFFMAGTTYGDGCYHLYTGEQKVAELGVDSGTLAAIPIDMITSVDTAQKLGHIIELGRDETRFSCDKGVFTFGSYTCKT